MGAFYDLDNLKVTDIKNGKTLCDTGKIGFLTTENMTVDRLNLEGIAFKDYPSLTTSVQNACAERVNTKDFIGRRNSTNANIDKLILKNNPFSETPKNQKKGDTGIMVDTHFTPRLNAVETVDCPKGYQICGINVHNDDSDSIVKQMREENKSGKPSRLGLQGLEMSCCSLYE